MKSIRRSEGGMDEVIAPIAESEASYSSLQLYFLRRLNHLIRTRQEQAAELNSDGLRLIDLAIYSTYCDACDLDIAEEAQKVLRRVPVTSQDRGDR